MTKSIRWIIDIIPFLMLSVAGPIIQFVLWDTERGSASQESQFWRDTIYLLWPAQPIAAEEITVGPLRALADAIILNMALFGIWGLLTHWFDSVRAIVVIWAIGMIFVVVHQTLGAGFNMKSLVTWPLAVATCVMSCAFIPAALYRCRNG